MSNSVYTFFKQILWAIYLFCFFWDLEENTYDSLCPFKYESTATVAVG